jgi:TonB family protein
MLFALVLAAQIGFIFLFGEREQIVPRAVTNVPTLQLADDTSELLALNDPTLFALPNPKDFASSVWLQTPVLNQPSFRWNESPHWLQLPVGETGAAFNHFMQTNRFENFQLQFKPQPKLSEPILPLEPASAQTSRLQIEGDLAARPLLAPVNLPSLPYDDAIAPSKVQVLVDAAGDVVSVVLLESSGWNDADQSALRLARAARFAPSSRLAIGRMIFYWYTVPPSASP